MNVKPISINPVARHVHFFNFTKVAVMASLFTVGAIALAYDSKPVELTSSPVPNTIPSEYGVMALKLNTEKSGVAVIKLDGFRVHVGFDFEAHPDSYGVADSSFTAIEINNLSIDEITDIDGNSYRDFTDYNDHRNINQLISAYIEKNNLVEAV